MLGRVWVSSMLLQIDTVTGCRRCLLDLLRNTRFPCLYYFVQCALFMGILRIQESAGIVAKATVDVVFLEERQAGISTIASQQIVSLRSRCCDVVGVVMRQKHVFRGHRLRAILQVIVPNALQMNDKGYLNVIGPRKDVRAAFKLYSGVSFAAHTVPTV